MAPLQAHDLAQQAMLRSAEFNRRSSVMVPAMTGGNNPAVLTIQ